jgi:hypothetical protein
VARHTVVDILGAIGVDSRVKLWDGGGRGFETYSTTDSEQLVDYTIAQKAQKARKAQFEVHGGYVAPPQFPPTLYSYFG